MEAQQESDFVPIPGFENYYVSKDGRIVNKSNVSRKPRHDRTKQKYVARFFVNKKEHTRNLSYIILSTFSHDSVLRVLHIDGDLENYHFDNLIYGPAYSQNDASIPMFYEDSTIQEMNTKEIINEKLLKDYNKEYYSYVEHNYRYYIPKKEGIPTYYRYIQRYNSIDEIAAILYEQEPTDEDIVKNLYHTAMLNTYYDDKNTYYDYHWKFFDCIEIWKEHPTLTDCEFSSEGRCRTKVDKVLRKFECSFYNGVKQYIRPIFDRKQKSLHSCVLEAFEGFKNDEKYTIDHIDRDIHNNRYENLRFATSSEQKQNQGNRTYEKLSCPIIAVSGTEQYTFYSMNEVINTLFPDVDTSREGIKTSINKSIRENKPYKEYRFSRNCEIEGEEWRYVPKEFPELKNYQVSDYGRILTIKMNYPVYGEKMRNGYREIGTTGKRYFVHRIIAFTFLGKPESYRMVVNHKDENRENNKLSNLEFCTFQDNVQRTSKNGKIIHVSYDGEYYKTFHKIKEAGEWLSSVLPKRFPNANKGFETIKRYKNYDTINGYYFYH